MYSVCLRCFYLFPYEKKVSQADKRNFVPFYAAAEYFHSFRMENVIYRSIRVDVR